MSMSTRIDDLPGPLPQDIVGDLSHISNSLVGPSNNGLNNSLNDTDVQDVPRESRDQRELQNEHQHDHDDYKTRPSSNIRLNIRKRVHFEDEDDQPVSITAFLRSQFTEENVMLLIVLILASRSELDRYLRLVPYVNTYMEADFLLQIFKAVFLLLVFLVVRHYVLPNIRI